MVILQARLAHDLIARNVLTHEQYIKSLERLVADPASAHDKDPLLFDAVARAAITLFQQPLPPSEQLNQRTTSGEGGISSVAA